MCVCVCVRMFVCVCVCVCECFYVPNNVHVCVTVYLYACGIAHMPSVCIQEYNIIICCTECRVRCLLVCSPSKKF